jgi:phage shock protein E
MNLIILAGVGIFVVFLFVRRMMQASAARKLIADGALVLDVRTKQEFSGGHVEGAHLFPVHELGARLKELEKLAGEKTRPIVVYCRSGARSAQAAAILQQQGYSGVVNGGAYAALAR